ncbi:hypothetical protein M011DRAFT_10408 [Sporormia fimetaria CBS 119925]|uniref:HMG box domain-containing protein n=1 Tax=Sporormia fimetaria CBS 119925 TaxID=1340428 RepID=A0A6A6VMV8_9PLEO|nr:hypothetical protein M011DRAFT_10408 [Sporormia fimetaria CBS 119925]
MILQWACIPSPRLLLPSSKILASSTKSVQQISTECAAKWASLTEKEKDFWREEAALKKKAHELMYPDYKFSPRRPGEKKKRQSNKAVKAAKMDVRAAAVALEFSLDPQPAPQLTFDFNDFPGQPLPTAANMTEASLAMPPTFTMDTINAPVPPNPNEDFLTLNVSMPPVYQDSFFAFGTGTDAMGIDNANAFTNSNGATVTHGISTSPVTTNDSPDMAALAAFMDDVNRDIDALDVYGGDGRWHSGHDRAGRGSDMSTIWEFFEDGTGLSDMQSQEYYRQDRLQAELANMFPDFEEQAAFASDTKLANEFNMSDFINE